MFLSLKGKVTTFKCGRMHAHCTVNNNGTSLFKTRRMVGKGAEAIILLCLNMPQKSCLHVAAVLMLAFTFYLAS